MATPGELVGVAPRLTEEDPPGPAAVAGRLPRRRTGTTRLQLIGDLAPHPVLLAAVRRAREAGVTPLDELLATAGIDGEAAVRRLGRRLGVATLTAGEDLPAGSPTAADAAAEALRAGVVRLGDGRLVVAARGPALAQAVADLRRRGLPRRRLVLASPQRFADFIMAAAGPALVSATRDDLETKAPHLSARPLTVARSAAVVLAAVAALLGAVVVRAPLAGHLVLSVVFLTLAAVRLAAALAKPAVPAAVPPRIADQDLPVYTVLVPLYRERRALSGLLGALEALDYPASKLDIKLLIEENDTETRRALEAITLPGQMEVLRLPAGEPRTKPRALNVGLAAARGEFLVVYDAEDRPEPNQLRGALAAFSVGPRRLACVQARLAVDNGADGWLARLFAIEYMALFDAFLPGLAALGLAFPLGGSSNHFRTAVLRTVHGWDAWNVTEDADIAVRLARHGFTATMISSSTYEEAPNRLVAWTRQRTRWIKGHILTWWLHACSPRQLLRDLGLWNFLAFNAVVGGVPLATLALPALLMSIAAHLAKGDFGQDAPVLLAVDFSSVVGGFAVMLWLAICGVRSRGAVGCMGAVVWLPAYWLLASFAALRAVYQLAGAPHLWEKTEHRLRRGAQIHRPAGRQSVVSTLRAVLAADPAPPSRRSFLQADTAEASWDEDAHELPHSEADSLLRLEVCRPETAAAAHSA